MTSALDLIQRRTMDRAPIIVVHGTPGIGKTTFASKAPSPVFALTEDGLGDLEVDAFPQVAKFEELKDYIVGLGTSDHGYKTLVIDSLSALEPLIWDHVCKANGWPNIKKPGYGNGYDVALEVWRDLMKGLHWLSGKGITPLLIAHSEIKRYDPPGTEPYDRYQIKLNSKAFALLYEQADVIAFAYTPVHVSNNEESKNVNKKNKARPLGDRVLVVEETPAIIAKNRFGMTEPLNMEFSELASRIKYYNKGNN